MAAKSAIFANAWTLAIVGLVVNIIALVAMVVALSYFLLLLFRTRRRIFANVFVKLYKTRKQLKKNRLVLDEFLHTCYILGISHKKITDTYMEMHRNRRQMGEAWLFGDDNVKTPKGLAPAVKKGGAKRLESAVGRMRRQIPIFRSFAENSQFTQGFDGFRLHRLLHAFPPSEYQSADLPEAGSYYQITELCSTMRKQVLETLNPAKRPLPLPLLAKSPPSVIKKPQK